MLSLSVCVCVCQRFPPTFPSLLVPIPPRQIDGSVFHPGFCPSVTFLLFPSTLYPSLSLVSLSPFLPPSLSYNSPSFIHHFKHPHIHSLPFSTCYPSTHIFHMVNINRDEAGKVAYMVFSFTYHFIYS